MSRGDGDRTARSRGPFGDATGELTQGRRRFVVVVLHCISEAAA